MAQILDCQGTHGWLIAALLREVSGLEGKAMFECVESSFDFNRCLCQVSVEAPRLWLKMATQLLANVEEEWMRKRMGTLSDFEDEGAHQICSFIWADNFSITSHSKKYGTDATRPDLRSKQMGLGTQTSETLVDKYV